MAITVLEWSQRTDGYIQPLICALWISQMPSITKNELKTSGIGTYSAQWQSFHHCHDCNCWVLIIISNIFVCLIDCWDILVTSHTICSQCYYGIHCMYFTEGQKHQGSDFTMATRAVVYCRTKRPKGSDDRQCEHIAYNVLRIYGYLWTVEY
jgi:hypothetical protein